MTCKFAKLLLAWCALALRLHAGSYVLTCDPADHGIAEGPPPFALAATGNTIRVGTNNSSTPGRA